MSNYRTNAHAVQEEAKRLFDQEGLAVEGWSFRINNRTVNIAGRCRYSTRVIEHSATHLKHSTLAFNLDTIRHEVAHAITKGDGHGAKWKAEAIRLGANGSKCYSMNEQDHGTLVDLLDAKRTWLCVSIQGQEALHQFSRERIGRPLHNGMWTKGKKRKTAGTLHYVQRERHVAFKAGTITFDELTKHLTRDGKTSSYNPDTFITQPVAAKRPTTPNASTTKATSTYTSFTASVYKAEMAFEEFLLAYTMSKPNAAYSTVKAQYGRIKKGTA